MGDLGLYRLALNGRRPADALLGLAASGRIAEEGAACSKAQIGSNTAKQSHSTCWTAVHRSNNQDQKRGREVWMNWLAARLGRFP